MSNIISPKIGQAKGSQFSKTFLTPKIKEIQQISQRDNSRKASIFVSSPKEKIEEKFNILQKKINQVRSVSPQPAPSINQNNSVTSAREIKIPIFNFKKKDENFKLEISSSDGSSLDSSFEQEISSQYQQAKETIKRLISSKDQQPSPIGPISYSKPNRLSLPVIPFSPNIQEQKIINVGEIDNDKINLLFIKSLEQNYEDKDIEEQFDNGDIIIDFHSKELTQFIRYENKLNQLTNRLKKYSDYQNLRKEQQAEILKFENQQNLKIIQKQEQKNKLIKQLAKKHNLIKLETKEVIEQVNQMKIDNLAQQFIEQNIIQQKQANRKSHFHE